jgi:hypothetical protein
MAALVGRNVVVILGHVMDQLLGPDQLPGTAGDSAAQRPGQQLYQRLCRKPVDISSTLRTTKLSTLAAAVKGLKIYAVITRYEV